MTPSTIGAVIAGLRTAPITDLLDAIERNEGYERLVAWFAEAPDIRLRHLIELAMTAPNGEATSVYNRVRDEATLQALAAKATEELIGRTEP